MIIWKFPIKVTSHQVVIFPEGAKIIRVGLDPNDIPCLWAIFDETKRGKEEKNIFIHGTGQEIDNDEKYMGSFKQNHTYVWHVFSD